MFPNIDDYSNSKEVQCLNHERLQTCDTYVDRRPISDFHFNRVRIPALPTPVYTLCYIVEVYRFFPPVVLSWKYCAAFNIAFKERRIGSADVIHSCHSVYANTPTKNNMAVYVFAWAKCTMNIRKLLNVYRQLDYPLIICWLLGC